MKLKICLLLLKNIFRQKTDLMKYIISLFLLVFIYILVFLISFHYYFDYYNLLNPEDYIYNFADVDSVYKLEILDTIEICLILVFIVCFYFSCFSINKVKTFTMLPIIISNFILIALLVICYLYWNTSLFYEVIVEGGNTYYSTSQLSYAILKLVSFAGIVTSIILNIIFITKIVEANKSLKFLIFIFMPFVTILYLFFYDFFNSKEIFWYKKMDVEFQGKFNNILNINLSKEDMIWYKGLTSWITYQDFLNNSPLKYIK